MLTPFRVVFGGITENRILDFDRCPVLVSSGRDAIPNPKRMVRTDAADIARRLLSAARSYAKEYALFVGAKGESLITPRYGVHYTLWIERWPGSLCGVYTPEAKDVDIIADVLGMESD